MAARKAIIHIGTHKTGTKSIQSLFIDNFHALQKLGLYVPQTGRIAHSQAMATPGQHGLATALRTGDEAMLTAFADEVRASDARSIFISSEEFPPMVGVPDALRRLRDLLASLGYTSTIVVYLRPQDDYAQSVYAELTKGGHDVTKRFATFVAKILANDGLYHDSAYPMHFAYSKILRPFAELFGAEHVVARRYDDTGNPNVLLLDFARVTNSVSGVNIEELAIVDAHLNRRGTFANVLTNLYNIAAKHEPTALSPFALAQKLGIEATDLRLNEPFGVLSQAEAQAFEAHFAADNALVESMTGITLSIETANRDWETAAFQRAFLDFAGDVWFR